ncbi:MAG TPA: membrane integrity-associated transporter subunit PqiC [Sulfurovum sp.]|nr:membrane integrity-associated transporter subunit PqiC [Sulfurovum sp.]
MKTAIFIVLSFVILGCTGSSKQYILSVDNSSLQSITKKNTQIGVDKVSVPGYMEENRIAIQESAGAITYSSDIWAVPTAKALTQTLIRTLQKRFSNPNVYLYPWDIERENGIRVKVTINSFIYSNGTVNLEATYFTKRIGSKSKRSHMYSTQVPSSSDTAAIVKAMSIAFGRLSADIAQKIPH